MDDRLTRRGSLAKLGGLLAAAAGGGALLSHSPDGNAAIESGAVQCVLTPELTEGPYYIAGEKVRRDIREGHPGTKLTLKLTVLDAKTCKPVQGAAVDVWHADAAGNYSGFSGDTSSRTFMRGIQRTDRNGLAEFVTVYPGWYQGRAVHIHVKVHVGGSVVHTGQLFFPDAVTKKAYEVAPYSSRPGPDLLNAQDSIYVNGGRYGMLKVQKTGAAYAASIAMGVHR
ncbi:MAG TPA: intradiol ring-cleavage dioxygenase [Gaiellaceae bacterium]|nr:intradiol ring-cleavage dioxygenase [Gaiellaceae bacterium]